MSSNFEQLAVRTGIYIRGNSVGLILIRLIFASVRFTSRYVRACSTPILKRVCAYIKAPRMHFEANRTKVLPIVRTQIESNGHQTYSTPLSIYSRSYYKFESSVSIIITLMLLSSVLLLIYSNKNKHNNNVYYYR